MNKYESRKNSIYRRMFQILVIKPVVTETVHQKVCAV